MGDASERKFLSQAEFARHRGVSKKAVTVWKQKGLLVLGEDGRVNVDETEWKLDDRPSRYRGGVTHRPVRAVSGNSSAAPRPAKVTPPRPASARPADTDDEQESDVDFSAPDLKLAEAVRRKENYLGLQRKQEFEKNEGALVDRAAALKLFFDTSRENRDAWRSWSARIAVTMADELGVDARLLTTVLTAYVQQHLVELGEPQADLG